MSDESVEIRGVLVAFTSVQENDNRLFAADLPVAERRWSWPSRRPQVAEIVFDGEYEITRVMLAECGSDQTTDCFDWEIYLRNADGGYTCNAIVEGHEANIVRGGPNGMVFSRDNDPVKWPLKSGWSEKRDVEGPLDFTLDEPLRAIAGQLRIANQHGWGSAVGLRFFGRKVGELPLSLDGLKNDYAADMKVFQPNGRPM